MVHVECVLSDAVPVLAVWTDMTLAYGVFAVSDGPGSTTCSSRLCPANLSTIADSRRAFRGLLSHLAFFCW